MIAHWRFKTRPEEPTYGMLIPGEHTDIALTALIDNETAVVRRVYIRNSCYTLVLFSLMPPLFHIYDRLLLLAQKALTILWCSISRTGPIILWMLAATTRGLASDVLWKSWFAQMNRFVNCLWCIHLRVFEDTSARNRTPAENLLAFQRSVDGHSS